MSEYEEAMKGLDEAETRIQAIDYELDSLYDKLKNVRGEATEVYSRIVGYYRNVNNWNPGKKSEYADRIDMAPNWMKS